MTDQTAAPSVADIQQLVAPQPSAIADIDINALIQAARIGNAVGGAPTANLKQVEPAEPASVSALIARRAAIAAQIKALTAEDEKVKDVVRDILGDAEELVVNGAVVATYKTSTARSLDTDYLKKVFPDTPENAEMWKSTESRRLLFK